MLLNLDVCRMVQKLASCIYKDKLTPTYGVMERQTQGFYSSMGFEVYIKV